MRFGRVLLRIISPIFGKRKFSVCRNRTTNQQSTSSSGATPPKVLKQGTLNTLTTAGSKRHEIDLQLARYMISSSTAFLRAENKELQKMFDLLRPGTKVSCCYMYTYLNKLNINFDDISKIFIKSKLLFNMFRCHHGNVTQAHYWTKCILRKKTKWSIY